MIIKHLLLSTIVAFVVGIIFFRLSSSWSGAVFDVGHNGAWVISGVFQIIYSILASVGLVLAYKPLIFFGVNPRISVSIATTVLIVSVLNTLIAFNLVNFSSQILFALVFIFISCFAHLLIQLLGSMVFEFINKN